MAIKKMSYWTIADVLEAQPINISNWLIRAAQKSKKVNKAKMKI
jgi:TfoX/Sxy family transcriptional regulator of competence genes